MSVIDEGQSLIELSNLSKWSEFIDKCVENKIEHDYTYGRDRDTIDISLIKPKRIVLPDKFDHELFIKMKNIISDDMMYMNTLIDLSYEKFRLPKCSLCKKQSDEFYYCKKYNHFICNDCNEHRTENIEIKIENGFLNMSDEFVFNKIIGYIKKYKVFDHEKLIEIFGEYEYINFISHYYIHFYNDTILEYINDKHIIFLKLIFLDFLKKNEIITDDDEVDEDKTYENDKDNNDDDKKKEKKIGYNDIKLKKYFYNFGVMYDDNIYHITLLKNGKLHLIDNEEISKFETEQMSKYEYSKVNKPVFIKDKQCDICNSLINDGFFYECRDKNKDICKKCSKTEHGKEKIIEWELTMSCINNKELCNTFNNQIGIGSILDYIPIYEDIYNKRMTLDSMDDNDDLLDNGSDNGSDIDDIDKNTDNEYNRIHNDGYILRNCNPDSPYYGQHIAYTYDDHGRSGICSIPLSYDEIVDILDKFRSDKSLLKEFGWTLFYNTPLKRLMTIFGHQIHYG